MPELTVVSWNVAGLCGLLQRRSSTIRELAEGSGADVVCLQETKLTDVKLEGALQAVAMPGWHVRWNNSSEKRGHSGVMTLSRERPLREHDGFSPESGRLLMTEFAAYILVNVYVPNSGRHLVNIDSRLKDWDPAFREYVHGLQASGKPVIVAGDMNCAPDPIDCYDPVRLRKQAGFTIGERVSYREMLDSTGLVDSWRSMHPQTQEYSFFSNQGGMRGKGLGWRLDQILIPGWMVRAITRAWIAWTTASDHNPVGVILTL